MSAAAIAFSVYFGLGLLCMTVAVARSGKEKRTKGFEASGGGDLVEAVILIFIALLWPLWVCGIGPKGKPTGPTSYDAER